MLHFREKYINNVAHLEGREFPTWILRGSKIDVLLPIQFLRKRSDFQLSKSSRVNKHHTKEKILKQSVIQTERHNFLKYGENIKNWMK